MKHKQAVIRHEFVEFVPEKLEAGVLYISIPYATASHLCCCGCGHEVVTPITPTDWNINFNGVSVSLYPSIGNWSFECQSHYWVQNNSIIWSRKWSKNLIEAGRNADSINKDQYYGMTNTDNQANPKPTSKSNWISYMWRQIIKR